MTGYNLQLWKLKATDLGNLLQGSGSRSAHIQSALEAMRSQGGGESSLVGRVSYETKEDFSSLFAQIRSAEFLELSSHMGYEDPIMCAESLLEQVLLNQIEVEPSKVFLAILCDQISELPQAPEDPIKFTGQFVEDFFSKTTADEAIKRKWIQESERETWEGKIATWKNSFGTLMSQMEANEPRMLFSPDSETRKKQYENFATRMLFFLLVLVEKEEVYDFFDRCVPDFLDYCYTRWDQEIFQLQRLAYPEQMMKNQLLIPQFAARELRRDILQFEIFPNIISRLFLDLNDQYELIADVHYIAQLKQCANDEFGLGFTKKELGDSEFLQEFAEVYDQEKWLFESSYFSERIKLELSKYWGMLSPSEKEFYIDYLVGAYREATLQGKIPLTQKAKVLSFLYGRLQFVSCLEDVTQLRALRAEFQESGVEFPFKILPISTEEVLIEFRTLSGSEKEKRRINQTIKDLRDNIDVSEKMIEYLETLFPDNELLNGLKTQDQWIETSIAQINRSIEIAQEGVEEKIAMATTHAIRSKLAIGDELTPFGLSAWMVAGKVAVSSDPMLSFLSKLESLDLLVIEHLETSPEFYFNLSETAKFNPTVLKMIQENPGLIYGVSKEQYIFWMQDPVNSLRGDFRCENCKEVVFKAVEYDGIVLQYASNELRSDKDVVLEAVKNNVEAFEFADDVLKKDMEFIFNVVRANGLALQYVSEELRNDRAIVLEAVRSNGEALQYASKGLRDDRMIVLEALRTNGEVLRYASEGLRDDRMIVLEAVRTNGGALRYASEGLRSDRIVVLEAVRTNGEALRYASEGLRGDRIVVLEAVSRNGGALRWVSEKLRSDEDVVLEAVGSNFKAFNYANLELKTDRMTVLKVVRRKGKALRYASEILRDDEGVVLEAVRNDGWALEYASVKLRGDRKIVLDLIRLDGRILEYASDELKADKDVVLEAVKVHGMALVYASKELKFNKDVVFEAVTNNGLALQFVTNELKNNKNVVLKAVENDGLAIQYTSKELRNDRDIALKAVSNNGWVLYYLSEALKADREIVFEAVKNNKSSLIYANAELQFDPEFLALINTL